VAESSDVCTWLRGLGLERYEEAFRANEIDWEVLPELNEGDLVQLGIPLGPRKKLLRAIATLHAAGTPEAQPADSRAAPASSPAERRQVTVLFCDLVGSTELSGRYDPEDLRELLRHYHDAMTEVVVRHGGYVANYLGDGILAYFGWPRAEEDEAAQAVRAGLAAVAAARKMALHVHVGIASGTVVVGDLEAAGRRQAGAIAGETPNLAARLEALAGADQVVIGGLTRQLVGAAFVLDDLGPQELKGIAEPVRVWQVLAERSVESRFDARAGRLTRFIGREHEVALLLDRFERAAAGEGQAVLLSGEAGIGKSRIIRQLHERLSRIPHTRLRFQCSPSHTESALYPIIRHLEYAAGFQPDDKPETRLDKLEALLGEGAEDVAESAALLAPLLSLPVERYRTIELTAEQRSERTFNALIDQLLGLAAKNPVLYILEDAHWLDPTTREAVTRTLGRIADVRVLMLITHRPEFQSDWARHPQVTALTLSRLSRGQGAEVVRAAGGEALSDEIVTRILRRADGVPLYIEELTKSVIETGIAGGDNDIPETLQASLLARLDRLGADAKEAAQLAAVIGREFDGALLGAVSGKPEDQVDRSLQRLVASELVLPTGPPPDGAYAFRHALIQDAAYQSLLLSRRRQCHGQIAAVLDRQFPELVESQPDLVARHYTAADAPEQAIPYWLRAGKRALARYAVVEPIAYFERGLELARRLSEGEMRSRLILDLLLSLGDARFRSGRHQASLETFREAADFARKLQSAKDLAEAAVGAELTERYIDGPERESVGLLEAALRALGDSETLERCRVLSHLGRALFSSHLPERATQLLRNASDLARRLGDRHTLVEAWISERITTAGRPCAERQFAENREALQEMFAIAEEIGDPHQIGHVLAHAIPAFLEMADRPAYDAMFASYGELIEKHPAIAENYAFVSNGAVRAILHGEFAEAEGLAERALELGRDSMRGDVATGVYGVQMFTIRREQGRLAEVAPVLRRFLDQNPEDVAWRPGLALIASDLGFKEAARNAFDNLAVGGFAFPIDAKWSLTVSYLAEVCARLGDVPRARQLYDLLLPYRDVTVIAPQATVCCGSAARYLGMLASVIGDWPRAEEHFEAALAIDERLEAWPWLAHTQYEFAAALLARGAPGCRVRADSLLAAAAETAQRLGMTSLQQKIRSHAH
jgi:class 3 adenylate cyclase/tetratricopeptide (TPR) repeat protein